MPLPIAPYCVTLKTCGVPVAVGVGVAVLVGVAVSVAVGVAVNVGVGVLVAVGVGVGVGVVVKVGVGDKVGVGVKVGGQFVPSCKQMAFEFNVVATLRLQGEVEHSVDPLPTPHAAPEEINFFLIAPLTVTVVTVTHWPTVKSVPSFLVPPTSTGKGKVVSTGRPPVLGKGRIIGGSANANEGRRQKNRERKTRLN